MLRKRSICLLIILSSVLFFSVKMFGLRVHPDKENVVANSILGRWVGDRLLSGRFVASSRVVEFVNYSPVAVMIPSKYNKFLADKRIYLAGYMRMRFRKYPFILIQYKGNPYIIYFRKRDGDPMGDAESFIAMLARGKTRSDDLLFIGGDFNGAGFRAYKRVVTDYSK